VALGCLIVLLASAATSAVFVSGEVRTLRDALSQNKSLNLAPGTLASAGFGDPETILLVGNDQRNHTTTTPVLPHSNEMLLVRFDPSKPYISMMSIPRELMVTIRPPNRPAVTTRLNYAYTAGGIPLLVSTIRQVTGLSVNHVVVIDFNQFKRAVDQMGCVYSTVDRRYYHVNLPVGPQYQEIDLQPGYQRMCGDQALPFVSYRHDDTSLVRDARDQSFLLDVKKQYGPTLVSNVHTFEQIFGRLVQTDSGLHSTGGILNLIGTLISSSSLRVRQVQFQVNLVPGNATPCACDTATPQQISASVHSFLFGSSAPPKQRTAAVANAVHHRQPPASLPLVPTSSAAVALARSHGDRLSFPLEFPRVQDRGGSVIPVSLRNYLIYPPGGGADSTYVAVFSAGQLGQYYDVQGSEWMNAPQFAGPDQSVQVGARSYELYYQGQHLQTVAWFEHGAVYWIHNSLLDSLGNGEMLAIAEQTTSLTTGTGTRARRVTLKAAPLPIRPSALSSLSARELIGSLGGLVTLLAVPLLAIPLLRRWRDLQSLRAVLQRSLEREAQLGARLGALPTGALTAGGRLPPAVAPRRASSSTPQRSPMTVHTGSASRSRTRVLIALGVVILAVAAGLAFLLTRQGGHAVSGVAPGPANRSLVKPAALPALEVSVLNAGSVRGAAARTATQLRSQGVKIAAVGDFRGGTLPRATEIEYAAGERAQAARLARLLAGSTPTIAPVDPGTQAAAGKRARLVVIIP
jgi:LCP family protein required for cell wall assembly